MFKPGVVYTVAEGILFVPTVYYWRHAVGVTDRFLLAECPRYYRDRGRESGTAWFRLVADEEYKRHIFGVRPRYQNKIVEVSK